MLLRRAREDAGLRQRELTRMLPPPVEGRPFDHVWISRVECGAAPPPHPMRYAPVFSALESAPVNLPQFARSAAYIELALSALTPVVEAREHLNRWLPAQDFGPGTPDLELDGAALGVTSTESTLPPPLVEKPARISDLPQEHASRRFAAQKTDTAQARWLRPEDFPTQYPELFDILAVGRARVEVGLQEFEADPNVELIQPPLAPPKRDYPPPGMVRRHFKRTATSPRCDRVEKAADALRLRGILSEHVLRWALDSFDVDIVDAWIHIGAQMQIGAPQRRPPLHITIGA